MALRPQFSLLHSEFNEFLFATIGLEGSGIELTVLSALTRLGIDPWLEAARLSDLPGATAARALAADISALPEGNWKVSDAPAIAARLVACLPQRGALAATALAKTAVKSARSGAHKAKVGTATWLICLLLFAAAVFAISHRNAAPPSESDPGAVSTQR